MHLQTEYYFVMVISIFIVMTIITIVCVHGIIIIVTIIIIIIIIVHYKSSSSSSSTSATLATTIVIAITIVINMVDINDTASWLICIPVNGTLNKLKGLPKKDLQMFQMLHCPKKELRPDRIEGLYV